MIGEFTEKARTYENIAKANGLEITKELKDTITDYLTYENQIIENKLKEDNNNRSKYIKSQTKLQRHFDSNGYGRFYFEFYSNIYKVIEGQFAFRLLYLATALDYKNRLVKKIGNTYEPLSNSDLFKMLKLGESEFRKTKRILKDSNILIEKDNSFYINDIYCKRGEVELNKKDDKVRTFDSAIKELYEKSLPREHKTLSMLFELLPYVNYKHNIVCKNISEEIKSEIIPYSMKELCPILGIKNQTVLKNKLLKLTVNGQPVVAIILVKDKSMITINPRVYYKGNDVNDVKDLESTISAVMNE